MAPLAAAVILDVFFQALDGPDNGRLGPLRQRGDYLFFACPFWGFVRRCFGDASGSGCFRA